jgi:hypothetical protein
VHVLVRDRDPLSRAKRRGATRVSPRAGSPEARAISRACFAADDS